mmetsp:Transcript_2032/g.3789  ORF Transcript_2032/g.3789 Transcript_2032/m.3789 type:complete len:376 (-) Transcript_2032:63-1190(-)
MGDCRVCAGPLAFTKQVASWASYLFSADGSCRPEDGLSGFQTVWEACFPVYHPTTVPVLEERRQTMSMALVGQLSVVIARVLTGHLGGGAVGLIVFIVGNNARCSLQASNLTCYVALGFTVGSLDIFELVQRLFSSELLFQLPFTDFMARDLETVSMVLAPLCEMTGAQTAWNSYLSPSMLFESQGGYPVMASHGYWPPQQMPVFMPPHHAGPNRSLQMPYPDPLRTRMPMAEGLLDGQMPWSSMFGGWPGWMDASATIQSPHHTATDSDFASGYSKPYGTHGMVQRRSYGGYSDAAASSSRDRPNSMSPVKPRTNEVQMDCSECGEIVAPHYGRLGTGEFTGKVYCGKCWSLWSSLSHSTGASFMGTGTSSSAI